MTNQSHRRTDRQVWLHYIVIPTPGREGGKSWGITPALFSVFRPAYHCMMKDYTSNGDLFCKYIMTGADFEKKKNLFWFYIIRTQEKLFLN